MLEININITHLFKIDPSSVQVFTASLGPMFQNLSDKIDALTVRIEAAPSAKDIARLEALIPVIGTVDAPVTANQ